jgi:LysR family transcriptional regulator, cys regulon transcriptional activator
VAILPSLCVDAKHDLDKLDASHLIAPMPHFIGLHPESFVRGYVYDFIETFSPEWTTRRVGRRMRQSLD